MNLRGVFDQNTTDPIFQRYKGSFFGIRGVFFFKTPRIRGNTHVIKNGLITCVKKVRGVLNINAILSLNFEISRRLSSHLLSTLLHFRKENSVAFWTDVYPLSLTCEVEFQYLIKHLGVNRTSYDGNKYNLERKPIDYTIHYKSKEFIPDSYYEFNLKNTDHKQMMKNNLETENEISNDFNRRTRQAESGQPISEIKTEDDERAENLKLLLEEYNKDYITMILYSQKM